MSRITQQLKDFESFLHYAELDVKPHQIEGVKWALERENDANPPGGIHGGLLADEMGLGKTIVMMGLIVSNFVPRTLVVLPLALLEQWANEIKRTMGHSPLVFHGKNKKIITSDQLATAPIVLTTYGEISLKSHDNAMTSLHQFYWNRVIFDEAHHLRNSQTQTHIGATAIKATNRWLMTGTPIQNQISDFYSLCDVMGLKSDFYMQEENLATIGKTFLLKRTKSQVGITLPPLSVHEEIVDWENQDEKQIAQDIHSMLRFSNVQAREEENITSSLDNHTVSVIVKARQTCIYPALMKKHLEKVTPIGNPKLREKIEKATNCSSKLNAVEQKVLERRHNKRCKIIFCHFCGEIDELSRRFINHNMTVSILDGRTSALKRKEIIQSSPDILILQIQTGCEGLNLQQFSEIYFVSPHWNPAIEDQAIARAHRIGQTQKVEVFRFIMEGFDEDDITTTIDSHAQSIQEAKRDIMQFTDGNIGKK